MENEIWKDIKGYDGYYQISNQGRVKSLARTIYYSDGRIRKYPEKILKTPINNRWIYKQFVISVNSNHYTKKVHRVVAETFIPNPLKLPQVNHIDGNKLNNYVLNLEWCTSLENNRHARLIGLTLDKGEENSRALLTNQQVREIRALKGRMNGVEIGKIYGVNYKYISQILRNKRYVNI